MKENSIKEDIKNAEHFIKSIKTDKEYKEENGWHGYYHKEIVELTRILEHILSDYKRVLKENEELKEENEYNKILLDMNNNFTIDKKTGNYKWNVIEIQKIKDKIKEEKMPLTIVGGIRNKKILEYGISLGRMQVLQELIEEREEK